MVYDVENGHKEYWIPFARGLSEVFKQDRARSLFQPTKETHKIGREFIIGSNPSLYMDPNSDVSLSFINILSHQAMSSTDLVIRQHWGLTTVDCDFPQLCGSKREDIFLVCNTKSPSKAKNLEL